LRRLLALLLATALGAASAHAGERTCGTEVAGVEAGHDDGAADDDGCGDCGSGCGDCACCRAPLALATTGGRPSRPLAAALGPSEAPSLEGVRAQGDIFQPPRA
jgi:hypothetical protein